MTSLSVYQGARNGDKTNSEAQFQGRVVENAFVDQFEIEQRDQTNKRFKLIYVRNK
jgi:hypothetical protein